MISKDMFLLTTFKRSRGELRITKILLGPTFGHSFLQECIRMYWKQSRKSIRLFQVFEWICSVSFLKLDASNPAKILGIFSTTRFCSAWEEKLNT
jgi:hypothetical protein